jgi:hypothetical protein
MKNELLTAAIDLVAMQILLGVVGKGADMRLSISLSICAKLFFSSGGDKE